METVTGFGGFFFRARDPVALAAWYSRHLGVSPAPTDMQTPPWRQQAGVTVFAPFPEDSAYFAADHRFMLNFRVRDLDKMVVQLQDAGIDIFNRQEMEGLGRFAHLRDPEGTPIELWEPAPTGDSE